MNLPTESSSETIADSAGRTLWKRVARQIGRCLFWLIAALIWLWCVGAVYFLEDRLPGWIKVGLAAAIAILIPAWLFALKAKARNPVLRWAPLIVVWLGLLLFYATIKPTHDREWSLAQRILPRAEIGDGQVTIHGIRSFRYGPVEPTRLTYSDRYDLEKLESVWFGVDRFTELQPMAHTFLSFGFSDGQHQSNYLAFSIETRRESDEEMYSPIRGIYKNYETMYVIADEQDVLSVRTDVRQHVVQLYPVKATKAEAQDLFLDLLQRANEIHERPEFYHTLKSNCTNNLVYHANKIVAEPISTWQRGVVFPGYSDWLALKLGMIDTELPLEVAREKFRIDQKVQSWDGSEDFSDHIRR